jgi:hypothetical protein
MRLNDFALLATKFSYTFSRTSVVVARVASVDGGGRRQRVDKAVAGGSEGDVESDEMNYKYTSIEVL